MKLLGKLLLSNSNSRCYAVLLRPRHIMDEPYDGIALHVLVSCALI